MSILRAALLASSHSSRPPCRPAASPHLCRTAKRHRPALPRSCPNNNNNNALGALSNFRVSVLAPRLSSGSSSSSSCWRHWWPSASFWTRLSPPVVRPPIGASPDCRGEREGCSCCSSSNNRAGDFRKWTGGNSSSCSSASPLNRFSNYQQQQQESAYAAGASRQAAAAVCFSSAAAAAGEGRRMRSRGNGEAGRPSPPGRVGRSFSEVRQGSGVEAPLTDLEKDKFKEVKIKQTKELLTLPTVLTLARVAAVPAILAVFYSNEPWATSAGAVIFVLASVTDWLDGYLARRMGTSSAFGAFLDPVADKLMVAAALVLLCTKPLASADFAAIPWLLPLPTIAIIGREITMSAVREWAAAQGGDLHKAVAVNSLGKIKTASQMVSITLLLASGEGGLDSQVAVVAGVGLLYVSAILALWSLAMYMRGIWGSMFK